MEPALRGRRTRHEKQNPSGEADPGLVSIRSLSGGP